jgi:hypothetical protein
MIASNRSAGARFPIWALSIKHADEEWMAARAYQGVKKREVSNENSATQSSCVSSAAVAGVGERRNGRCSNK